MACKNHRTITITITTLIMIIYCKIKLRLPPCLDYIVNTVPSIPPQVSDSEDEEDEVDEEHVNEEHVNEEQPNQDEAQAGNRNSTESADAPKKLSYPISSTPMPKQVVMFFCLIVYFTFD